MTTQRVQVLFGGQVQGGVTSWQIKRDLSEIAGTFRVEILDQARWDAVNGVTDSNSPVQPGMSAVIKLDGTTVLIGWVDEVEPSGDAQTSSIVITGRDKTGDLVDCAAAANGPTEFKNLTLDQLVTKICAPFGITVTTQAPVGTAFSRFALQPHDKAFPVIDSACKQRAVLPVSDGVGGLLLTTAGTGTAPAPLTRGVNIWKYQGKNSLKERFSDYYCKGQTDISQFAGTTASLDHLTAPGATADATAPTSQVIMTGHAQDPAVTRYRPTVRMTRTQSGMSSVQDQAEWAARVAIGEAESVTYTVKDWRAGSANALWLPNQLVQVLDPMLDIDDQLLIAGVSWFGDSSSSRTELRLVGKTAFDQTNLAAKHKQKKGTSTALTSSLDALTVK